MKKLILSATLCASVIAATVHAQDYVATLRAPTPLSDQGAAPAIPKVSDEDGRRQRGLPEQPPTIPHAIRDYQVDLNANKCLSCHDRSRTGDSQAPMVSVTHFMDRDGQVLATVSPRRYFCNQCHVPQADVPTLVENEFQPSSTAAR